MVTAGKKYVNSLGEFLWLKVSKDQPEKAERFTVKEKIGSTWTVVIENKDEKLSQAIAIDIGKSHRITEQVFNIFRHFSPCH